MTKQILIALTAAWLCIPATQASESIFSQKKKKEQTTTQPAAAQAGAQQAPKQQMPQGLPPQGLVAYKDLVNKNTKTLSGMFKVHLTMGRYFFEIPDTLFGRDMLAVTRISKSPSDPDKDKVGYPGDPVSETVIRFMMGPNNKVLICEASYNNKASDSTRISRALSNANMGPILAVLDVRSFGIDSVSKSKSAVVDMTDYILKTDRGIFTFEDPFRKKAGIGQMVPDGCFLSGMGAFPMNIEIRAMKTFMRVPPMGIDQRAAAMFGPSTPPLTYELNTSIVLLPKKPMKSRLADARVGYFPVTYTQYDDNQQGVERRAMITRWRLEPKPEDVEKYMRGELVEPQKPIVIYIDPATPQKWVPYLIQGVNDWQEAFEQAGFKNAIYALEAPKNDPSWNLEDARHSALVYKASDITNCSGPHIHDPRSGEIIETHINWYHNIMSLLKNWYTVQMGASDPRARHPELPDSLMGQLIRFVSSHEVGHTLGLRHNFGSSATVPVEKLRDKAWVEANGHTPSIMDYARFNYVAQPEDSITDQGIFPRIGIYDKWAIEWGYRWLPQFATPEDEISFSNESIISKLAQDKRYAFGGETDPNDPRNQSEDLGDDAMKAGMYGIKNLKRIVPKIIDWTKEQNHDYTGAQILYRNVTEQFSRYMGHAATWVGGIYTTPSTVEQQQEQKTRVFVPATKQREAVDFLNKQLFATPEWLIDKNLIEYAGIDPISAIGSAQFKVVGRLLALATIDRLARDEAYNGKQAYTPNQMFADLRKGIWGELYNAKPTDLYRRNLQEMYIRQLLALTAKPEEQKILTDATRTARAELALISRDLKRAATTATGLDKAHFQNLAALADTALERK